MKTITIERKSFDSGFKGNYKGFHIDKRLILQPSLTSAIVLKINKYQTKFNLLNNLIVGQEIFERIEYLNTLIEQCFQEDYLIKQTNIISNLFIINYNKEQIIHIMKRIIDDIITILSIYFDFKEIETKNKIKITSIGQLAEIGAKNNIKKELNYEKYENIFTTINDLHNAYKHSFLINESHLEFSPNCVTLSAYYAKNNKIDEIYYLNHNLMHIVIGFSDFLVEFCEIEEITRVQNILIEPITYKI